MELEQTFRQLWHHAVKYNDRQVIPQYMHLKNACIFLQVIAKKDLMRLGFWDNSIRDDWTVLSWPCKCTVVLESI